MSVALVVDDFKPIRDILRPLLIAEGFAICGEAADGKAAVEQARLLRPDVVVLDYSMTGMDGFRTAYEIRQFAPDTKIIVYSILDSTEGAAAARVVGASAFVSKLAPGEIVLAVRQLMKGENVTGTRIGP